MRVVWLIALAVAMSLARADTNAVTRGGDLHYGVHQTK